MNSEKLSPRLAKVCDFLVQYQTRNIRLADIGSDHAYLPCHLALNKKIEFAVAGEVVEGPFQSAIQEVSSRGLTDLIEVRKGDGLAVLTLDDQINAITICGMGGSLIRNILSEHPGLLTEEIILVLQPNMASYQLRQWLNQNGFVFLDETVVTDHQREYEVMVVQKQSSVTERLTEQALHFGPFNLANPTEAFYTKWCQELALLEETYQTVVSHTSAEHPKAQALLAEITLIKGVMK